MFNNATVDQSLTATLKNYLEETHDNKIAPREIAPIADKTGSVYDKALAAGYTLEEYVGVDAKRAIMEAETYFNEWLQIQTTASITGYLSTSEGKSLVNKNMAALIQRRVDLSLAQLEKVYEYAYTALKDGEQRKNHLIRVAYKKAVERGDTRMMIYLMDRVDGRPGESKVVDLDYDNAYNVYQIIHTLFDKQLEVLNSGNGTKMICCSRRSGKTRLNAAICLIEALRVPNTTTLYIGETLEQTELIVDGEMNQLIDGLKLRDKRGKRLDWKRLDNGSRIMVRGLSNTKDPDLIRGHKAKIIVVDEFFHLKDELLDYLIKEVLQPMQMDYATDYKFICAGTPPPVKGTYGEKAWKTWEVPHFFWTWEDNPFPVGVAARREYIDNILKEKGLDWSAPYARREYGGEWIYEEDLLLYPDYHTYDPREAMPAFNVDMVLFGLDYGVSDNDTLVGVAWDTAQRRGFVFHEDKFNRLDIKDRTISQLQYLELCVKHAWAKALDFFPNLTPKEANKRILWDADDNDQHVTDHLNMNVRLDEHSDLRLNIENAHKTDKVVMFDKIKDVLRTGALLLIKDGKTARECEKTILKRGPNGQIYPEVDLKAFHPDLLPAMRYALWNVIGRESAPKDGARG